MKRFQQVIWLIGAIMLLSEALYEYLRYRAEPSGFLLASGVFWGLWSASYVASRYARE